MSKARIIRITLIGVVCVLLAGCRHGQKTLLVNPAALLEDTVEIVYDDCGFPESSMGFVGGIGIGKSSSWDLDSYSANIVFRLYPEGRGAKRGFIAMGLGLIYASYQDVIAPVNDWDRLGVSYFLAGGYRWTSKHRLPVELGAGIIRRASRDGLGLTLYLEAAIGFDW